MKSIKPGRGPSFMGGIVGIFVIIFGVFWTVMAFSMVGSSGGGLIIFPLFGIMFIVIGIANTVYNFKNATGKNRFSTFDIVDSSEESDPFDRFIDNEKPQQKEGSRFCPYCGTAVEGEFSFCPKCGKDLPDLP